MKNIISYLKNQNIKIEYFDTLPSTNAYLKDKADELPDGYVVISESQTSGRGRFNRKFYSPSNSGIYMSILLKPQTIGFNATYITTMSAVAVSEIVEELSGKNTQIKWVNDVLIKGKKICGILTEGKIDPATKKPIYIVLGIGINAFPPKDGFNTEIKDIAGAVFDRYNEDLKNQLTAKIIDKIFEYLNADITEIATKYKDRLAFLGQKINVFKGDKKIVATALDVDSNCRLLVEYEDGVKEYLSSGEISIKI